eukprot:s1277_g3.t1
MIVIRDLETEGHLISRELPGSPFPVFGRGEGLVRPREAMASMIRPDRAILKRQEEEFQYETRVASQLEQFKEESKGTLAKKIVINSVIAYGVFGAVQVFYRLWKGFTTSSRMRQALKDMPATKGAGHDAPGGWIRDLQRNLHRLHDWRLEICEGRPISKNLGFSWSPAPYTLLANDPAIVRHILKDEFSKYTKPDSSIDPFFYYFEDFLGSGIFVQKHGVGSEDDGQEWSKMRKVSAQIFNRDWVLL